MVGFQNGDFTADLAHRRFEITFRRGVLCIVRSAAEVSAGIIGERSVAHFNGSAQGVLIEFGEVCVALLRCCARTRPYLAVGAEIADSESRIGRGVMRE